MVVTQEPLAADVGVAVLKAGGNAVDAAVAIGFALAVTYPPAGNIAGGGFLLARFKNGKTTFIDFRETAPSSAERNMYLDAAGNVTRDSVSGWRASATPGTVAGLAYAHRKYGRRPWATLIKPSVRLAAHGFPVPYELAESFRSNARDLSQFSESNRIFLNRGRFYNAGDALRQPELARVLRRIARHGANDFYRGRTARILAAEMAKHGGTITLADLKAYKPVERRPLQGKYKGYDIITAPPPSSGGIGLLQMLGVLEGSNYAAGGYGAASTFHYLAETMRRFFADRSEHLGDPDFFKVPTKGLLSPAYISKLRASIDPQRATPSKELRPGNGAQFESSETTHYSVVDRWGNSVAVTYTLNGSYGSSVTVPRLGVLMNNIMDDFAAKPGTPNLFGLVQGDANAIQPKKRPLSSMTPTIVAKDGKTFMVIGSPGGGRIITSVLQTFLNVVDFGMNIQDAVDAPRIHHQWLPDKIAAERISPDTIKLLEQRGHVVEPASALARVFGIVINRGWLEGAADARSYGKAAGY